MSEEHIVDIIRFKGYNAVFDPLNLQCEFPCNCLKIFYHSVLLISYNLIEFFITFSIPFSTTVKDCTLEIKDDKSANSTQFWIPSLSLYMDDYYALTEGRWLSDSIIHAGQMMLKEAFPMIGGFQATILGEVLPG